MSFELKFKAALLAGCTIAMSSTVSAQETGTTDRADAVLTDTIVVSATRYRSEQVDRLDPPAEIALPADAAAIAARAPGGALVGNGPISGQLSYRGLSGERVVGKVNGQRFASGGPNAMDPPMHYAPSVLLERIELARGVAPVSEGPGLAGAINAVLVETGFGKGSDFEAHGHVAAQYRSVDDSYAAGGTIGIANERWRLGVIASREEGDDYEIPGARAGGTGYERTQYGLHAGFRTGPGELFVEYRRNETDPTGNPPFAMDIIYFNTDFVQGGFRGEIADDLGLEVRLGQVSVRHLMDNQTLRNPPAPNARATFADADTMTGEVKLRIGQDNRNLTIGGDLEFTDKQVRITNPANAAFFLDAQPGLVSERLGAFAEWRGGIGVAEFQIGARVDRYDQSAGIPQLGAAVPMGPRGLANAFIASDRSLSDTVADVVVRAWMPMGALTPRLTLARKTRVPSLLERFAWLPTEASYGLADGNIYVGNRDLRPETAWIAELGVDYESDAVMLRPTIFYRRVDDYIQGTPFDATVGVVDSPVEMVAAMNGDPTPLMFRNTDAELYGVDLDFRLRPVGRIEIAGTASWVRAKRRDVDDNLYRVAPPNLTVSAAWRGDRLTFGTELTAVAKQDKVSATNGELPSDGYAVVGLFGQYALGHNLALGAGVENLFDTWYQPHLAGVNRVGASDVALGEKLPGAGRGVWVRLTAGF
ncbi:TonB-dependent receptor [Altererythrobacter epoxidivorans]|uniref:TonB-dependent receptor n=1 Tax=Altererythrobacter epoxidivorans TaxID=361183 RepID=A0A0M3TAW8_9SPHN|nr:TonB-dependent receptor [Altererythrobacter epoxidivorans]ALE17466.1 TonB-dependent receptor [Altererythrobacter epoxidivorans]